MPGCRIGRDVVVGACSLVKKSIPDNGGTWAGTPARPLMRTKVLNNLLRESAMAKLTG
ncbi:Protein CapG (fragment) [uncultured Desulfobacterium sp.]|uniref:Protein CapG n=1 Tax=uncultured Desulfobacterium sp. TaxID=201089 RepID=A0A445MTB5_9BACT